jgi:hypothetical protein
MLRSARPEGQGAARFILTMPPWEVPSRRVSAGDSDGLRLNSFTADYIEGLTMKTILALSAVLLIAGCQKKADTSATADTSAMAPAMSDTGMGMTHSDSTMARDTTKK